MPATTFAVRPISCDIPDYGKSGMSPLGPPYGWSAPLDGLGYLSADRATGGVWVCPAQREEFMAYKNTYCAWTMPRGPGQDKPRAHYQIVWENLNDLPYPTGVPAEVRG